MANYCFMVPILPAGIDMIKKWNEEYVVNNKAYDKIFEETGLSRDQVWIQHAPHGDFAVVSFETKDIKHSFYTLKASNDPWTIKFREHVKKTHGLDLSQSEEIQPNELIIDWHR